MRNSIKVADAVTAAQIIAEFVRQGIVYEATQSGSEFVITTTGGF